MYPKVVFISAVMALCLFLALPVRAQIIHSTYRHFTVHDGLPQQQVTSLLQDSWGYIWVGTKYGISKYNGDYFENFTEKDGIAISHINSILEDTQGNIWVNTPIGTGYYDGVRWKRVIDKDLHDIKLIEGQMLGYDNLTNTLYKLNLDTAVVFKSLKTYSKVNQPVDSVSYGVRFKAIAPDVEILLSLNVKGEVVAEDTVKFESYIYKLHMSGLWWKNKIINLSMDGIARVRQLGYTAFIDSFTFDRQFINRVNIVELEDGSLLFYALDKLSIREPGGTFKEIFNLPGKMFNCAIKDIDGTYWLGAENGLYQYNPGSFSFITDADVPLPWGMAEDDDGKFWISSYGYGIRVFDGNTIRKIQLPTGFSKKFATTNLFYFGISRDESGNLYFSHNEGLYQLNKAGKWTNLLKHKKHDSDSLGKIVLLNLYDTLRHKVLAGVHHGVFLYDTRRRQLDSIILTKINRYIVGIAVDNKREHWWFSSARAGIARYHIPTGRITYFLKGENGVQIPGAICIEPDTNNGLWFGSPEGLYYYDSEKEVFTKIAPQTITKAVSNLKIVDDVLMAGDINGLFALDLKQFHTNGKVRIKAFNQYNGFTGIEPNQNGAFVDSKGNYWVLCSNQIAVIHKSKLDLENHPSKVRIYQINKERVPFSGSVEIKLPKGENKVTIRFESIGFQRPLRTEYAWRLPGYEDNWSEWSEDQSAFLSQLPTGHYKFEVRSRHPGSVDSTAYITDSYLFAVSLPFFMEPHFYQYAFYGFGLAVIVAALMAWFIRKARTETKAARQITQEREKLIKYYQIQTLQAQLNPHFIFNLLETIQQYVEQQKRPEAVEQIQRLAKLLRRFLDSSINSDLEHLSEGTSEITLATEIELLRYYIELEQIQKPGKFEYEIILEEGMLPDSYFVSPMVIQPFVENAIKRGLIPKEEPPRNLWVRFSKVGEGIRCIIEDTGIGMEASRALQAKSDRKFKPRGVQLVRERAKLLYELGVVIEIDMQDRPGGGTIVIIDFASLPGNNND